MIPRVAATALALLFFSPGVGHAADLQSLTSLDHGGKSIIEGSIHFRNDFSSLSNFWTFNFTWPTNVSNSRSLLAIARGTFGNLAGGTPHSGVNYSAANQSWGLSNSIVKSIGFPLAASTTPTGTYTAIVAQNAADFGGADTMQWFASGGASGVAPINHSFLTFEYRSDNQPVELPTALQSVEHAGRTITNGDAFLPSDLSNENNFWIFNFTWPNAVPNLQAGFYIFKGTFGHLEGGAAASGVNYAATVQVWSAGNNSIIKQFNLPLLTATTTDPGLYTAVVMERHPLSTNFQGEADWFASGGVVGTAPRKYSLITFELQDPPACCSSVMFLPGLKGSALNEGIDTVWPPTVFSNAEFEDDIGQLAINPETGESVNPLTVGGIVETFLGIPIYSGFVSFMNDLVADDVIAEWKPVPYDWRFGPAKIVADQHMVSELESLAAESRTGKVTIVAHSMGGLVGKELIRQLEAAGKAELVDTFVMVGSPQLGTPQAAASLLHGDGEDILGGFLVDAKMVRAVAQDMPSAYTLLPSPRYFDVVSDPVVTFDPNAGFTEPWRTYWGQALTVYLNFFSFVTGGGVARFKPPAELLRIPEVLRPDLASDAAAVHQTLDSYDFPDTVRVVEVAGWGLPTTKAINYTTKHFLQNYTASTTREGDGTVVYPSAIANSEEKYFFNIFDYNDVKSSDIKHRDLLNSDSLKSFISSILKGESLDQVAFISILKPTIDDLDDQLVVSTHSPVILGVYDSHGNFTGISPDQDLSLPVLRVSEGIPGSYFTQSADTQAIFLPQGGVYEFMYHGIGDGPTTVDIATFANDTETPVQSFVDIPTNSQSEATFTVDGAAPESTAVELDINGDGTIDYTIPPADDGVVEFPKAPLTTTASSTSMVLGDTIPQFSYHLSGFVAGQTATTSDVTGSPVCTTTATVNSTVGTYPITCSAGTLDSQYYRFDGFTPGELSVQYQWTGFKKPVTERKIFKRRSRLPVRFELLNAQGQVVRALQAPQWLPPVQGAPLSATSTTEALFIDAEEADSSAFRFNRKTGVYSYVWKTKDVTPGYWYHLSVKLDDGTIKTVVVGLK